MADISAKYGLYNPAFTQDIGQNMLAKMSGNRIEDLDDYKISGTVYTMDNIDFQKSLSNDKFESSSKKDKLKKGIIIGVAALTVLLVGKKFGGKIKTLLSKIPGVSTLGTKISKAFTGIKSKIKLPKFGSIGTKFKSLGSKIKNFFKK